MKKRIVLMTLALTMILNLNVVYASDNLNSDVNQDDSFQAKDIDDIYSTDIYITYVNEEDYPNIDSNGIDYVSLYNKTIKDFESNSFIKLSEKSSTKKLSRQEVKLHKDDKIIKEALKKVNESIDSGINVKSINIILPNSNNVILSDEIIMTLSDEDFWLNNTSYWGYSGGHNFRYYWIDVNVESDYDDIENRPSTWDAIKSGSIKVLLNRVIDIAGNQTVTNVWSVFQDISTIFGNNPYLTYFDSNNEWIKGKAAGTLYYKEIVIEDIDDKIVGNSYYPWGYASYLEFKSMLDYKCCISNINNHRIYDYFSEDTSLVTRYSENYNDSFEIFDNVIYCYNMMGYQTYNELVELDNIVPKFE